MNMWDLLYRHGLYTAIAAVLVLVATWLGAGAPYALMVLGFLGTLIVLMQMAVSTHRRSDLISDGMLGLFALTLLGVGALMQVPLSGGWPLLPALIVPVVACYPFGSKLTREISRRQKFLPAAIGFFFLTFAGSASIVLAVPYWHHEFWSYWCLAGGVTAFVIAAILTSRQNAKIRS